VPEFACEPGRSSVPATRGAPRGGQGDGTARLLVDAGGNHHERCTGEIPIISVTDISRRRKRRAVAHVGRDRTLDDNSRSGDTNLPCACPPSGDSPSSPHVFSCLGWVCFSGAPSSGEMPVPYLACAPYHDGSRHVELVQPRAKRRVMRWMHQGPQPGSRSASKMPKHRRRSEKGPDLL
jgi:hypothetical protein